MTSTLMDGAANRPRPDDDEALPMIDRKHYKIADELARGGMGRIVLARDRRLGRTVAVKEALSTEESFLARFDREVRLTARLQHPGIVSIYEAGCWASGEPFYAMRLIAGRPLEDVIAETTSLAQRLALLPHVLAIAEALAYAHAQRIIHRDLKPANVLVGTYGETVVIDWGLAKDLEDAETAPEPEHAYRDDGEGALTMLGAIMGTPSYMPIEQATGQAVDERADVYAIGAILYQTLCGKPPYEGPTGMSILGKLVSEQPPRIAERVAGIPPDLVAIVDRAMAREATDRYRDAKELADDLRRFQTGQLVASHTYTRRALVRRWLRKYRTPVAIVAVATVALAAVGVASYLKVVAEKDRANAAAATAEAARTAADAARAAAAKRADDLTIVQARTTVAADPTAAVAWLAQLSPNSPHARAAQMIATDAANRGVAWVVPLGAEAFGLAATADGKHVIAGDLGAAISDIDVAAHTRRVVGKADAKIFRVAISGDAAHAVVASEKSIALWDLARGTSTTLAPTHESISIAFARDGSRFAYPSAKGEVAVCPTATPATCAHLTVAASAQNGLHLSADGKALFVAVAGEPGKVVTYDATVDPPTAGATVPAGNHILDADAAWSDDRAFAWIAPGGKVPLAAGSIDCDDRVAMSGDAKWIACLTSKTVKVFAAATGKLVATTALADRADLVAFGPDVVAVAASDGEIRIARLDTPMQWSLVGHRSRISALAFVDGGAQLASIAREGVVRLWPIASHRAIVSVTSPPSILRTDAHLSDDGRVVVWGEEHALHARLADGKIVTLDEPAKGGIPFPIHLSRAGDAVLFAWDSDTMAPGDHQHFFVWHPGEPTAKEVTGDGGDTHWLAGGLVTRDRIQLVRGGKAVVLDPATGADVWRPSTMPKAWAGDLATAFASDKTIVTVMTATGDRKLDTGVDVQTLVPSVDGRWLGVLGSEKCRLCDVRAGTCRDVTTTSGLMASGTMSADGRRFVVSSNQMLEVFDTTTGATQVVQRSHGTSKLALSADGELLVGLDTVESNEGWAGTAFVRDLVSGEERRLMLDNVLDVAAFVGDTHVLHVLVRTPPILLETIEPPASLDRLTNATIDDRGQLTAR